MRNPGAVLTSSLSLLLTPMARSDSSSFALCAAHAHPA